MSSTSQQSFLAFARLCVELPSLVVVPPKVPSVSNLGKSNNILSIVCYLLCPLRIDVSIKEYVGEVTDRRSYNNYRYIFHCTVRKHCCNTSYAIGDVNIRLSRVFVFLVARMPPTRGGESPTSFIPMPAMGGCFQVRHPVRTLCRQNEQNGGDADYLSTSELM